MLQRRVPMAPTQNKVKSKNIRLVGTYYIWTARDTKYASFSGYNEFTPFFQKKNQNYKGETFFSKKNLKLLT